MQGFFRPERPPSIRHPATWEETLLSYSHRPGARRRGWRSSPSALSACFLKNVLSDWDLADIYKGMMQFTVSQVIGRILLMVFPRIALWLPEYIYRK